MQIKIYGIPLHIHVIMYLFQRGFHIYEFKNYCTQDRDMELGDEATKVFLNARGNADDISPRLKEFLNYVVGKEQTAPSPFIDKLKQALSHAKQNREWRRQHMSLFFREMDIRAEAKREGHAKGHAEGHAEGLKHGRMEMILSMIKNGADREFIKTVANLSDEELNDIIAQQ